MSKYGTRFEPMDCTIYKQGTNHLGLKLKRTGRSYEMMVTTRKVQLAEVKVFSDEADHNVLLHWPFNHFAADRIRQGVSHKSCAGGPLKKNFHNVDDGVGPDCGKMIKRSFKLLKKLRHVYALLRLVHTDVCSSLSVKSTGQTR